MSEPTEASYAGMKWWGWGDSTKYFSLDGRPRFVSYLGDRLKTSVDREHRPVDIKDITIAPPEIPPQVLNKLAVLLGEEVVSTEARTRIGHAMGKGYRDLVRVRKGQVASVPDAVIWPASERDIEVVLSWAQDHEIAVVPFGGGSSVVGGVEAKRGATHKGVVSLDMARMNRICTVDTVSRIARIQAGTPGPVLERALNERGFSLGHFPQSFEYSTLGGWVATRSAGQLSSLYGKIEHMVTSVAMVTPRGRIETLQTPARAVGPDVTQLVVGSEGTLGVITEVSAKIHPLPEEQKYAGFFFKDFLSGIDASRAIIQEGLTPAVLRLSDAEETQFGLLLKPKATHASKELAQLGGIWALDKLGYRSERRCLMILGFEGRKGPTDSAARFARRICKEYGAIYLGESPGKMWHADRFEHPYLRDTLLDRGIMIDTLETSTDWHNVIPLYYAVSRALKEAIRATGVSEIVMCHLSHVYPSGSSLYFIFLGKQVIGGELEQWYHIKKAASDCILEHGGTISHHHGVGMDHAAWANREHGELGIELLKGLKHSVDPGGIMNPGKLICD